MDLGNKSREFRDLYGMANPLPGARAKVPLLEVVGDEEGTSLFTESLVVADYVAEEFGRNDGGLLPSSTRDRAITRLFGELCASSFSYFAILRAEGDAQKEAVEALKDGLASVDTFLKHYESGPFLLGNQFSLAECNAAPFVQRMCTLLPAFTGGENDADPMKICDELGLDNLKAWMEAVLKRQSVIETGVPEESLIDRTKEMLERFAAQAKEEASK